QTMEALEYELNKCLSGRGVAVAQILGMTTDPNVVASLNPGLSMRTLDDGIVKTQASARAPNAGSEIWETRSGVARMQSSPVTGRQAWGRGMRRQSGPTSNPAIRSSPNLYPRVGTPAPAFDDRSPSSGRRAHSVSTSDTLPQVDVKSVKAAEEATELTAQRLP